MCNQILWLALYYALVLDTYYFAHVAHKYDNFIVGLTNTSRNVSTRTLWNYAMCGQYQGVVPNGTTVPLDCQDNLTPFRYVIVQRPQYGYFVLCEIEVLVRGTRMSNSIFWYFPLKQTAVQCCYVSYRHDLLIVLHGKMNMMTMMFSRLELQLLELSYVMK